MMLLVVKVRRVLHYSSPVSLSCVEIKRKLTTLSALGLSSRNPRYFENHPVTDISSKMFQGNPRKKSLMEMREDINSIFLPGSLSALPNKIKENV